MENDAKDTNEIEKHNEQNKVPHLHPVTLGSSEIVLETDDDDDDSSNSEDENCREVVRALQNDRIFPNSSAINIESSSDVVIGPLTQFHGPVTIYQNVKEGNRNSYENVGFESKPERAENQAAKIVPNKDAQSEKHYPTEAATFFGTASNVKIVIVAVLCVAIVLSVVITVLTLMNQGGDDRNQSEYDNDDDNATNLGDHLIFTKRDWGGRPALNFTKPLKHPTEYVIISHTAGAFCHDFEGCSPIMQQIQAMHVAKLGSPDIGYNFLIGGDGNIYSGRGWNIRNFHTDNNIGICFIGNFVFDQLNQGMVSALEKLLDLGIKENKLARNYTLVCHNQTYSTLSPGQNVYKIVSKFPHFRPGPIRF